MIFSFRKKHTFLTDVFYCSSFLLVLSCCKKSETTIDSVTDKLKDIDGNIYSVVTIGDKIWMKENLKATRYSDGTPILSGSINTGTYVKCSGDTAGVNYGLLYNWYAVNSPSGLCPVGWHVSTDQEWTELTSYLGENDAAGKLKEAGTFHWSSPNTGATNETGFTALPGGWINMYNRTNVGSVGRWWTSTENDPYCAWYRIIYSDKTNVYRKYFSQMETKFSAYSVRCIKDDTKTGIPFLSTADISHISFSNCTSGGIMLSNGGSNVTQRGVCWGVNENPTIENNPKTNDGSGNGAFTSSVTGLSKNTIYYLRAYAINNNGTGYGNQIQFNTYDYTGQSGYVNDIDGHIYKTVGIGNQIWMAENLKTTKYNDGTPIPTTTSTSESDAMYWYNNDSSTYKGTYGALYNWYAVTSANHLCPTGWHSPSQYDWEDLLNFLGGGNIAGSILREAGSSHWNSPNSDATNQYGFCAVPGGAFYAPNNFYNIGIAAFFWSTTWNTSITWSSRMYGPYWLKLTYNSSYATWGLQLPGPGANPGAGISVRCLKDR
jgi:uncharacterized protein (TIGR02145 family)